MTQSRGIYRLNNLDVIQLNFILEKIGSRLDEIEGYRGTPTLRSGANLTGVLDTDSEMKYTDSNGTVLHSFGGT